MEKFIFCYSLVLLFLILYPNHACLAARELLDDRSDKGESQRGVHGSEPSPDGSARGRGPPRSTTGGSPLISTSNSKANTCTQYNRCRMGGGTTRIEAPKYDYNKIHGKPKDRYKYHIPPDTNN